MLDWEYSITVPSGVILTDETVDAFIQGFHSDGTAKERSTANGTYPSGTYWAYSRYAVPEAESFGTKRIPGTDPFYFYNQEAEDGKVYAHFGHLEAGEPPVQAEHYGMKWERENPDPKARCTYLYDCAGFTPMQCQADGSVEIGSWANAFFVKNNYPAMMKPDGTLDYKLDPNDHTKDINGNNSNISNHETDNAMSVFDCHIWIKMAEDETYQYVEVANQKLDDDFVDWPYIRENGTHADRIYYPMFEGIIVNDTLRSLATGKGQGGLSAPEELDAAKENGSVWSIGDWCHHLWLTLLSMLVGKTTCVEMSLGEGNTNGGQDASGFCTNGECVTYGQFWGKPRSSTASDNRYPVKIFYVENPYGNRFKRTLGLYYHLNDYYARVSPPYTTDADWSDYEYVGDGPGLTSYGGYVKDLILTNAGFLPGSVGGSETTYTGSYFYDNLSKDNMLVAGGLCAFGQECGFWDMDLSYEPWDSYPSIGASLYMTEPE